LNLIEVIKLSFSRFLNVKWARINFFSSSATNSSSARIYVSSVWRSTISKWLMKFDWLMKSMNSIWLIWLMCSKHESNVDSIIESFFLWCVWYVLNQCVSVSSTSYRDLTTRRIEFFDKSSSKNERMKNCLLKEIFDCTYAWVMFFK
jgi:hypothetical protein